METMETDQKDATTEITPNCMLEIKNIQKDARLILLLLCTVDKSKQNDFIEVY